MWTENLLFQIFSVHSQKRREIEIKTLCIRRETGKISKQIFERKVDSGRPRRENVSEKIV